MQRKVFRVEAMMTGKRPAAAAPRRIAPPGADIERANHELAAAIDGMETATQKILKAVEVIDDSAKALSASLRDDYKRGLAQDIQDSVVRIYESCNFQDIAGQRIGNVMTTLATIERHSTKSSQGAAPSNDRGLLNGPKLDGDPGHASQRDIDTLFG